MFVLVREGYRPNTRFFAERFGPKFHRGAFQCLHEGLALNPLSSTNCFVPHLPSFFPRFCIAATPTVHVFPIIELFSCPVSIKTD